MTVQTSQKENWRHHLCGRWYTTKQSTTPKSRNLSTHSEVYYVKCQKSVNENIQAVEVDKSLFYWLLNNSYEHKIIQGDQKVSVYLTITVRYQMHRDFLITLYITIYIYIL
jgi:hypothetical protein